VDFGVVGVEDALAADRDSPVTLIGIGADERQA
jgi:hypothetical protein